MAYEPSLGAPENKYAEILTIVTDGWPAFCGH